MLIKELVRKMGFPGILDNFPLFYRLLVLGGMNKPASFISRKRKQKPRERKEPAQSKTNWCLSQPSLLPEAEPGTWACLAIAWFGRLVLRNRRGVLGKGKVIRKGCQLLSLVVKGFTMGGSLPVLLGWAAEWASRCPRWPRTGRWDGPHCYPDGEVLQCFWASLTDEEAVATGHVHRVKGNLEYGIQMHKY